MYYQCVWNGCLFICSLVCPHEMLQGFHFLYSSHYLSQTMLIFKKKKRNVRKMCKKLIYLLNTHTKQNNVPFLFFLRSVFCTVSLWYCLIRLDQFIIFWPEIWINHVQYYNISYTQNHFGAKKYYGLKTDCKNITSSTPFSMNF